MHSSIPRRGRRIFGRPEWAAARVLLLALVLPAAACSRNVGTPPADERPPALFRVEVGVAADADSRPELFGVLFVGVRPAGGGPPVLVARAEPTGFPYRIDLTEENLMGPYGFEATRYVLFARYDMDGDAGTVGPGDWDARSVRAYPLGTTDVRLALRQVPQPATWLQVRILSDHEAPDPAVGFVIVREADGRVPLAARRIPPPASWPHVLRLDEGDILHTAPPPDMPLEVIVRIDQDGDPLTTTPGDLEGRAPVVDGQAEVRLEPGVAR